MISVERKRANKRRYYYRHRERLLAEKKASSAANNEEYRAHWRAYNKKRAVYLAEYRLANMERDKRRAKKYLKTPEGSAKQRARNALFRKNNPGRIGRLTKAWLKRNPERLSYYLAKRSALRRGATGSHTLEEWKELCKKFDNKCAYCGRANKLTRDHIEPLTKGGSDFISNILPSCQPCNSSKGNRVPKEQLTEWIKQRRGELNA